MNSSGFFGSARGPRNTGEILSVAVSSVRTPRQYSSHSRANVALNSAKAQPVISGGTNTPKATSSLGFQRHSMEPPRNRNAPLIQTQATGLMMQGTKAQIGPAT